MSADNNSSDHKAENSSSDDILKTAATDLFLIRIMSADNNSSDHETKNDSSDGISNTAATAQNASVISHKVECKRHERKFIFEWHIHDFSCKTAKPHEGLPSTNFEIDFGKNMFFYGNLSLTGKSCESRTCLLDLKSLYGVNWGVSCEVAINEYKIYFDYTGGEESKKIKLLEDSTKKLCLLKEGLNIITLEVSLVTYKEVKEPPALEIPMNSLQADMVQLFESKIMADIEFEVQDQIIVAHKLILATRCEFFAAMFKQTEKPGNPDTNKIIKDIEPKVFNEILRYIYTDNVPDISKMPKKLLIASNKFDLDDLKRMCEMELASQINVDNVSDLLIIADNNQAKHLKNIAINFIKTHCKQVANTPGWQIIMNTKLHILPELLNQIIE